MRQRSTPQPTAAAPQDAEATSSEYSRDLPEPHEPQEPREPREPLEPREPFEPREPLNGCSTMKDLSRGDRPREKLQRHGVAALGDNELLALVIGSGSRRGGALAVANELLAA